MSNQTYKMSNDEIKSEYIVMQMKRHEALFDDEEESDVDFSSMSHGELSKRFENNCKSCYKKPSRDTSVCTAPCGHKLCFQCIVLMAQLNHRCPCCKEDIINTVDEDNSPFPVKFEKSKEKGDKPIVSVVAVCLDGVKMTQNVKTKKCFLIGGYNSESVDMSAEDLKSIRLDVYGDVY